MNILIQTCLIVAAFGLGCYAGLRDAKKKPHDHRQPFRYWRP